MSSSATEYDEPAAAVSSFMRPFVHDGRYACYDNAACNVDDEDDESPLDSLSTIRGEEDEDDERLLSVDGYEGDGDSDEYGCGEHDDDEDGSGEYTTYGSDFSVEELHEFMLQQEQQSMLDYAYSLRRYSLLETIREETSDELRGDAASEQSDSCSGVWCWGDDFTDGAESVIYVDETPIDAELEDDDDDASDGSDRNTEAESSSDSTGSIKSVEMAPLSVLGPRRQSPGGHLEDPSEREGSWLDAEAEPDLQPTSDQAEVHIGNGWDSQSTNNIVSSCSRTVTTTLVSENTTMATVTSSTVVCSETLLTKSFDGDASPPFSMRLAPSDLKSMDSAAVLSYLKSVLVSGDGDAAYRALLQRHQDKSLNSDTDLLILFDNEEATDANSATNPHTPPRYSDASGSDSPPDSEFPSWSDAIDAYLMSLEVDQATPSGSGAAAAPLWRRQVVGSDSDTTSKSCLGSVIPGHDLLNENATAAAPSTTHRSTESPPSCLRDGSPADFDGVEALERTAGDGAEEAAPASSCYEAVTATLGRRHLAAEDDCKPLRLSGVKSAPDLLLDDGKHTEDVHGVALYDSGDNKTQSVPCIASSSGDEDEDRCDAAEGGFGASKAFFGLGVSDLSCCQLDRGRFSQSLDSQFSRSFAGSSSGCASEEEEEEDDSDASSADEEERSHGSLSRFPRFTPPGALRSFRSFDTLHLAGQREEAALKRSSGSWMDGIEECSEREEKARPSSDNLSEDSGYCDAGLRSRSKMALLAETVDDVKEIKLVVDVFNVRGEHHINGEACMEEPNNGEGGTILEMESTSTKMALAVEDSFRMDRFQNEQNTSETKDDSILDYKIQPTIRPLRTNFCRAQTDDMVNDQGRESKSGLDAILEIENYPEHSVKIAQDFLEVGVFNVRSEHLTNGEAHKPDILEIERGSAKMTLVVEDSLRIDRSESKDDNFGGDLFQSAQTDHSINDQGLAEDAIVLETSNECSNMGDDSEDRRLRRMLLSDSERRDRGLSMSIQGASTFGHSNEIGSTNVCALNEVTLSEHAEDANAMHVDENVLGVDLGNLILYEQFENLTKHNNTDIPEGIVSDDNDRNPMQCTEDKGDHHQQQDVEMSWEKHQASNDSNVDQNLSQQQTSDDSWDKLQEQATMDLEIGQDSWDNQKITSEAGFPSGELGNQQEIKEDSWDQQQVTDVPIEYNVEDSQDIEQQSWPLEEENDEVSPPGGRNSTDAKAQCGSDQVPIPCQDRGHQTGRTPSPLTLSEKPAEACDSAAKGCGMPPSLVPPDSNDDVISTSLVSQFDEGVAAILGPEASHSTRAIPEGSDATSVNLGQRSVPAGGAGALNTPGKRSLINQTDDFIVRDNPERSAAAETTLNSVSGDPVMDNVGDSTTANEAGTIANNSSSSGTVNDQPKVTKIYAIITLVRRTSSPASVDDSSKDRKVESKTTGLVPFDDPTIVQSSDDSVSLSEAIVSDKDDSTYHSKEIAIKTGDISTLNKDDQTSVQTIRNSHCTTPHSQDCRLTLVDKNYSGVDDPISEICTSVEVESSPIVGVVSTPPKTAEASGAARDCQVAGRLTAAIADYSSSSIEEQQLPILDEVSRDKKLPYAGEVLKAKEDRQEERRGEEEKDSCEKRKEDGEGALSRRALNSSAFTPALSNTNDRRLAAVVPLARAGKPFQKSPKVVGLTCDDHDVSNIDKNALNVHQESIGSASLKLATTSTTSAVQKLSDRPPKSPSKTPSSGVAAEGTKSRGKKGDAAMSRVKQPSKLKRHLWWPLKIGRSSSSSSAGRSTQTQEEPQESVAKSVEKSPPSDHRPKDMDEEWDPDWIGTSIDVEPEDERPGVHQTYGEWTHATNGNSTTIYDGRMQPTNGNSSLTYDGEPEVSQTNDSCETPTKSRVIPENGNVVTTRDSIDYHPNDDSWRDNQRPLSPNSDNDDNSVAAAAILIDPERSLSSHPTPPSYKSNGIVTTPGKPPLPPTHRQHQQHIHHQRVQVAPTRAKIINARQHFVVKGGPIADSDSDDCSDVSAPRVDVHEALEQFRQRALEGKERVAKTVLDLSQQIQERCSSDAISAAIDPRRRVQSELGSSGGGSSHTDAITVSAVNGDGDACHDEKGDDFRCENGFSDENGDEEVTGDALIDGRVRYKQHKRDEGSSSASSAYSPPTGGGGSGARSSFRRLSASSGHGGAASASWRDSTQSIGYLETDIDTLHSREVIRVPDYDATSAAPVSPPATPFHGVGGSVRRHRPFKLKTQSMFNLTAAEEVVASVAAVPEQQQQQQQQRHHRLDCADDDIASRAKSMEFLLKDENKLSVLPPENQLRQTHGEAAQRRPSEHELRVRRSLQKLDLPDWYTSSPISRMGSTEGFILRKDMGQPTATVTRWADYRSRSSCNVDGSQAKTPVSSSKSVVISKRVTTPDLRYVKSSRESLLQSPMSPSPSSKDASSGYFYCPGGAMSRWSSSRLSCATTTTSSRSTSPTGSLRLPFQRQPYLGWRSSERLAREATNCSAASSASSTPTHGGAASSFYRSAAERLSQGPGYYAMRYGIYRTPGSETNLASPSQGVSRRGSNTSAATAPPDAGTMASPVTPLPPGYSPPDGSNHAGITVNVIEPNGYSGGAAAEETSDDSGQMLVADLVREIDKLIHRNGHSDDHLSETKEDDGPYKMTAVEEETKSDLASVSPKSATDRQQKFVWMESSFVGVRPIAKPESPPNDFPDEARSPVPPTIDGDATENTSISRIPASPEKISRSPASPEKITSQAQVHPPPPALFQTPSLFRQESTDRRLSLNSTTLEEVLDSLLALPSSSQSPSPSGYRPSKWESPEVTSSLIVEAYRGRDLEEQVVEEEDEAKPLPENVVLVADPTNDPSPAKAQAEHSVPDPAVQSAEGGSGRSSSSASDAGSTGSSTASSSANSHEDGGNGNGRASGSSGSDLTTATTTVASGSSSYRLSGSTSTGDSPSGSGNSQSSSLSASTSASGSGKEVIPPPPDFTDNPLGRSRQSFPSPSRIGKSMQESPEARLIVTPNTRANSDSAVKPHHSAPSPPLLGRSPTEDHQLDSYETDFGNADISNDSEEHVESLPIISSDVHALVQASISDSATKPHHSAPPSQLPPPQLIGRPSMEAQPLVFTEPHVATANPANTSEEPLESLPIITPNKHNVGQSSFCNSPSKLPRPPPPPPPIRHYPPAEANPVVSSEKHVTTTVQASTYQPRNHSSASEGLSASPVIMLCATGSSSVDIDDEEDVDVDKSLPEPRRSDSFPPPPTPEQFRELQKLHRSQYQQQSFDSDVALPPSNSFDSSQGNPSSSSCEPTETVSDASAWNDTRQESFDEIPGDDVSLATCFEDESVVSESTTARLDSTFEEDIMTPDVRRNIQLDDTVIVRCSHGQCRKTAELRDARKTFKTCHNCYTYYCSRECRKDHWTHHRRFCMYGRIRSMCKQAIQCCRQNAGVLLQLSKLARTGYITQGRGFVKVVFRNTDLAIRFLRQGWPLLEDGPMYVNWRDLIPQEMGDEVYRAVVDLCQRYDPETRFVLLVSIFITREVPVQSVPHWEREVIAKCARVSLSKFVAKDGHGLLNEDPGTLILTGPQQIKGADAAAARRAREVCLSNIEAQLRERGVSLCHQFPDAYRRLCSYVDNDDPFPPLTIYPKDGRTGNTFMCVIMPNSTGPQLNDRLKPKVK